MNPHFSTTRRQFLLVAATSTGGLLVGFPFQAFSAKAARAAEAAKLGYFVEINPDNSVILSVPKPDIGQGVATSLPMLLAEELDADFDKISVRALPVRLARRGSGYGWFYGDQGVGGSTSMNDMWDYLRQAGAEARRRLVAAAAQKWGISESQIRTERSHVIRVSDGSRLPYGALAAAAAGIPESEDPAKLKEPKDWTIIGTAKPMVDVDKIVTGRLEYGIDARIPGMLHAVIARAPKLGSKLKGFDPASALAVPGVRHVVPIEGPAPLGDFDLTPIADGVAVVADSHWAALKGREALKVEWTRGAMEGIDSVALDRQIINQMAGSGQVIRNDGNVERAFGEAERMFEARYSVPLVSHATLEPQGCIADVRPDGCEVIVPAQDTFEAMMQAIKWSGHPLEKIKLRFTRIGGGFGRRLDTDYVAEAVMVSKAIGRPVHVLWTREDDLRNDFYRPLAHYHIRAALGRGGAITGWDHKLASTGRYFRRGVPRDRIFTPEYWLDDFPAGMVPNLRAEYFFVETAIPCGPWRAPGHTANVFAVQSFLDEIAFAIKEASLAFRLRLLGTPRELPYGQHGGPVFDTGRLAAVLKTAARNAGWGEALPKGLGRGIAGHFTFGSYVAHVVDVSVSPAGELKILKVTSAVDCGIPINLNGVAAQTEGSINDGLSTALGQQITIEDGAVVEGNFDAYRMMRIGEAPPAINVEILRSGKPLKGMGEPAIPPVAPALTNAIFAATGKRIRKLPIADQLKA